MTEYRLHATFTVNNAIQGTDTNAEIKESVLHQSSHQFDLSITLLTLCIHGRRQQQIEEAERVIDPHFCYVELSVNTLFLDST